ncbi:efflux RND transporter periplasmic adaptor subunit [Ammoniphilus sp. CFH 90114]|uniref:efflux RND transporter periplasmic adaptor subunit n=1 Tax=Ammoniphilus sp. CFH 90114 TaxID=2493665 RepID=UPI00100F8C69|nr:efflux RND transporter periplasmic adaptor subunit [Ammoniphilus sp. CFH 90114]RXT15261.1 efflux RND transporter periplasmic adaptor subunit [Ammoniphilus sp. CFH 90114]
MKNMRLTSLVFMLALSLSVLGCSKKEEVSQASETAAVPVQVETVKEGTVEEKAGISGKLAPNETVQVSPKVNGKISKIHVTLGQQITQGDILFTLDQADLANAVKQAQAGYDVAVANLKQSESSTSQGINQAEGTVVQTNNAIIQAENGLAQATQALQDAMANEQRIKQLFEAGAVPTIEMEKAETALKNAELALKNAETTLANAKSSYDNAKKSLQNVQGKTGVEVARASVQQAQVSLQNAKDQLANATVKAPISGIISLVQGATGQMASPQAPVVQIVNIDPMLVKAHISENEMISVKMGMKVNLEIPALQKKQEATVTAVSPVMDSQLKAYPIEISIPNPTGELKADMVVDVKLSSQTKGQVKSLVVPRKAVLEEQGKRYVFLVEEDIAKKVEVSTGKETSEWTQIKTGLSANDIIVVKGQTLLQDQSKVEIQETK